MIVVERTEALMPRNLESKSLGDPLNGKVAELLKFFTIHIFLLFYRKKVLFGLSVESRLIRVGDETTVLPDTQLPFGTILGLADTCTKRLQL